MVISQPRSLENKESQEISFQPMVFQLWLPLYIGVRGALSWPGRDSPELW